jgi:hypothetical protein
VDTSASPYTLDVHEFWAAENKEPGGEDNEQVYRALLIVTDGTAPGAESISITWPVDDENEWVPYAYAGGAAVAVIGLVLLVVSIGRRRDEDEEELAEAPAGDAATERSSIATGAAAGGTGSARAEDPLDAPGAREVGEHSVWSFGSADPAAEDDVPAGSAEDADPAEHADPAEDEDQERR